MAKNKKLKYVLSLSAIIVIVVVTAVFILAQPKKDIVITNHYTLDVNPSFIIHADSINIVHELIAENPEGEKLLINFDYKGQTVSSVINNLIDIMIAENYLKEDEKNDVLIGYFGQDTKNCLKMLDVEVLDVASSFCKITIVSDSLSYMIEAEKDGGNPAKKKQAELTSLGNLNTISPSSTASSSITPSSTPSTEVSGEPSDSQGKGTKSPNESGEGDSGSNIAAPTPIYNMQAVTVKATITDNACIKLTWNKINDKNVMGYYILHSKSNPNLTYPGEGYLSGTNQSDSAEYIIEPYTYQGTNPGEWAYYSIATVYKDMFTVSGNVIKVTMPYNKNEPTNDSDVEIENISLSGYISGENLILNWDKSQSQYFKSYFVNCYEGYADWKNGVFGQYIYGDDNNSLKVYDGYVCADSRKALIAGKTYVFSVRAIYHCTNGGTLQSTPRYFTVTLPGQGGEIAKPAPKLNDIDYANYKLKFNFTKDENSNLDKYVICYSKSDSSPQYGDIGVNKLAEFSQYSSNVNTSYSIEPLEYGTKYYFSITSLYSNGTKRSSNTLSFTTPERFITSMNARLSDDKSNILLSWNTGCSDPLLWGYQIVGSKTTSNPTKTNNEYNYYIEGAQISSFNFPLPTNPSEAKTYYFSIITVYYKCQEIQSNTVSVHVPLETVTPQPTDTPTPIPSSTATPTPAPTESETPTPTPSVTQEATEAATDTPTPTPETTPLDTPSPASTPSDTPTAEETASST